MWIVRLALARPYTFIVLALLILILAPVVILRTPTDIFPNIDIPVIAAAFNYTGLSAEEMEERITSIYERSLTTTVNDIEHMESQSIDGRAIIKVFFQPGADINAAVAQVSAISQPILRQLPPGIDAAVSADLQRLQRPDSATGPFGTRAERAGTVRLRGELHPHAAGDDSRLRDPLSVRRQAAADHGGYQPAAMQSKGLSPADITSAIANQNLIIPAGTSKIGQFEYDVDLNSSPTTVEAFNDFPIKVVNGTPIYIRDIGHVRDGFAPQTNIVRQDGSAGGVADGDEGRQRFHAGGGGRGAQAAAGGGSTLPPALKIQPLADQSIFVRASINGVIREAVIAACLTGLMILLFLGSWRSTLIIAISIPLSILTSIIVLSALHETINIMTLGGLALAVGILVDDATVEIENVEPQPGPGQGDRAGDSGRRLADRGSGTGFHAVHLHRFPAHVLSERRGALPVRAAGGGGSICHAGVVRAFAHAGADAGEVPVEASAPRAEPQSAGAVSAGLRARV